MWTQIEFEADRDDCVASRGGWDIYEDGGRLVAVVGATPTDETAFLIGRAFDTGAASLHPDLWGDLYRRPVPQQRGAHLPDGTTA